MRRLLLSVMMGALGWALLAPTAAFAKFNHGNIVGTYVSTFQLNLNDQASAGVYVPSAGLQAVVHAIGIDVGKGIKQCPSLSLPSGITTTDIKTVAGSIVFGPGDIMSGVMQTTYDGAGSVVGEADFNIFKNAAYAKTKSLQTLNGVNSGFTSRICGGPAAGATMDTLRCGPVCTKTPAPPYNCGFLYPGTSGSQPNQGGGGYTTSADATISTVTSPTPNDVSSISVLHFYISAFGLCGTGVNSFAQCCNDPTLDMVMHIPTVNTPAATIPVEESFGIVGDPWASGQVHSVFSGTPTP